VTKSAAPVGAAPGVFPRLVPGLVFKTKVLTPADWR
jgi:hypothetical protein